MDIWEGRTMGGRGGKPIKNEFPVTREWRKAARPAGPSAMNVWFGKKGVTGKATQERPTRGYPGGGKSGHELLEQVNSVWLLRPRGPTGRVIGQSPESGGFRNGGKSNLNQVRPSRV